MDESETKTNFCAHTANKYECKIAQTAPTVSRVFFASLSWSQVCFLWNKNMKHINFQIKVDKKTDWFEKEANIGLWMFSYQHSDYIRVAHIQIVST